MRRLKSIGIISVVLLTLNLGGLWLWLSRHYVVPIMMYHNVDYTSEFKPNTVSPVNFERHMAYLKRHGFRVLSFDEFVQWTVTQKPIPKKSVVITFDDGYEDNYVYAFKTLKKFGYPATIFVISDLVGHQGHLTWDQIREMIQNGITIGSHTKRHSYLPDLPPELQKEEIIESKQILERQLNIPVDYFSYPIGGFSNPIKEIVKEAGYRGAAATNRGYDRFNKDVFELNRIRLGDRDTNDMYLWLKLSGYYNLFRKAKKPF